MKVIPWTKRTFDFDLQPGLFPVILERLRGTPARAEDILADAPEERLRWRENGRWSAKENVGHLTALGPRPEASKLAARPPPERAQLLRMGPNISQDAMSLLRATGFVPTSIHSVRQQFRTGMFDSVK
jgi:hypothetical protein